MKHEQEATTVKRSKRFFCALLALTMLFSTMAFATEESEELIIDEEVHLIMATEERRSAWTPSEAIVKFIANQEGFRATAHQSGGHWYIGYGTQIKAGQYPNGISREKALELLRGHITKITLALSVIDNVAFGLWSVIKIPIFFSFASL